MGKAWKKRGNFKSVQQLVMARSGMSFEEIISPQPVPPEKIANLHEAAVILYKNMKRMPVVIIGDYDADGVTATAILYRLLTFFRVTPKTVIPRRFSDGYGITEKLIDGVKNSLIITVDNGISAVEPIRKAKEQGNVVIVIDHHLPQGELPMADVILNPHVNPDQSPYIYYCGAGLVFKMAEHMLHKRRGDESVERLLDNLTILACIGTISDVMPLTGDNRRIVKSGLSLMNDEAAAKRIAPGILQTLLVAPTPIDAESVKYKIGPMLNAAGRLYDGGSSSVLKQLINDDKNTAIQYAAKMSAINDKRKALVDEWVSKIGPECERHMNDLCVVLYQPDIPEGIIGILTGKIAKQLKRPAFVFSDTKIPNTCKGSGRSFGDYDMSALVSHLLPICENGGGHAGAAGITVTKDNIQKFADAANQYMFQNNYHVDDTQYYDLEVRPEDISATSNLLKCMAPFGEGIEFPTFLVRGFTCVKNSNGLHYMAMGTASNHLKLFGKNCSAVGFDQANAYQALGCPQSVDLLCDISENVFRGVASVQLHIIDMRVSEPV